MTSADGLTLSGLLADGWSVVYDESYGTPTTTSLIDSWRTTAGSQQVFVGAVDASGNIILGATGMASEVLTQTSSSSSASSYPSSSLYWYNVPGLSFGFTPTSNIQLIGADVTGTPDFGYADDGYNDLRLSWHLDIGVGGWRAGSLTWLNGAPTPDKLVLVAPVPEPATYLAGLSALGMLGLFGWRNRK